MQHEQLEVGEPELEDEEVQEERLGVRELELEDEEVQEGQLEDEEVQREQLEDEEVQREQLGARELELVLDHEEEELLDHSVGHRHGGYGFQRLRWNSN